MTLQGRELLVRLLDLTPMPAPLPAPGSADEADIDQLLAAFEDIVAQRDAVIAMVVPPITLSETDRPLLIELERRQNIWQDTLAAALRAVGDRRCGASRLRAYTGPP
ncbi:MAG TPA: hypothetical protein VGD37_32065 [Kofleriaceae bacterium]|jgi:hypothetical protein